MLVLDDLDDGGDNGRDLADHAHEDLEEEAADAAVPPAIDSVRNRSDRCVSCDG